MLTRAPMQETPIHSYAKHRVQVDQRKERALFRKRVHIWRSCRDLSECRGERAGLGVFGGMREEEELEFFKWVYSDESKHHD